MNVAECIMISPHDMSDEIMQLHGGKSGFIRMCRINDYKEDGFVEVSLTMFEEGEVNMQMRVFVGRDFIRDILNAVNYGTPAENVPGRRSWVKTIECASSDDAFHRRSASIEIGKDDGEYFTRMEDGRSLLDSVFWVRIFDDDGNDLKVMTDYFTFNEIIKQTLMQFGPKFAMTDIELSMRRGEFPDDGAGDMRKFEEVLASMKIKKTGLCGCPWLVREQAEKTASSIAGRGGWTMREAVEWVNETIREFGINDDDCILPLE